VDGVPAHAELFPSSVSLVRDLISSKERRPLHIQVALYPKRVDPACVRLCVSILRQTLATYLARVDVTARRLVLQHGHQ
jgi:hypothetical protein